MIVAFDLFLFQGEYELLCHNIHRLQQKCTERSHRHSDQGRATVNEPWQCIKL